MRAMLPPRPHRMTLDMSLPIVNIVLLLIFFFLATGQLLNPPTQGVDLSETSELPLDQLPKPILIVADDGTWTLDGLPVLRETIGAALADLPRPATLNVLIGREAPASTLLEITNLPDLADLQIRLVTLRLREGA